MYVYMYTCMCVRVTAYIDFYVYVRGYVHVYVYGAGIWTLDGHWTLGSAKGRRHLKQRVCAIP